MSSCVFEVNGDNWTFSDFVIYNSTNDIDATAVKINGDNFKSNRLSIVNFPIGYHVENQSNIAIHNNNFLMPSNPSLPKVRAGLFLNCKSIELIGNTVIFLSEKEFQKIRYQKQVVIRITEYEKLKKSIKDKFSDLNNVYKLCISLIPSKKSHSP